MGWKDAPVVAPEVEGNAPSPAWSQAPLASVGDVLQRQRERSVAPITGTPAWAAAPLATPAPSAPVAPASESFGPSIPTGPQMPWPEGMSHDLDPTKLPKPEASYGDIISNAVAMAPKTTTGALAGVGRAIVETGDPHLLAQRAERTGSLDVMDFANMAAMFVPSLFARTVYNDPAKSLAAVQNEANAQVQENQPNTNGNIMKDIINSAASSLPQQIPGMAAAYITKNPEYALAPGMAISGGQEYGNQRAAGRDPFESFSPAILNAAAERVGERAPVAEMLDNPAKAGIKGAIKKIGRVAAKDAIGEGITQPLQDTISKVTTQPDMTLEEALRNEAVALGAGALTGGAMAAPAAISESRAASKNPQAPQKSEVTPPADVVQAAPPTVESGAVAASKVAEGAGDPVPTDKQPIAIKAVPEGDGGKSGEPKVTPSIAQVSPPVAQVTPPAPAEAQVTKPAENVSPPDGEAKPVVAQKSENIGRKKVVTPDGGMEIETQDEVIDASELQAASEDLQPRDRTKATSDMQIQKIANELDPERLGDSRTTDQGAPIVGPDNIVERGNGRVAAIRRAYSTGGESAAKYRAKLQAAGHKIDNIKEPVLIRRRVTDLSPEDRARFTSLSNKSSIAEMSSTEKARNDAQQLSDDMVDLHKGGEPDSADNSDFIKAFIGKVVTPNEAGALIGTDKRPTQEGIKRAKAALVAKAYGDNDLVENIFDSADPEVKSIGNVLRDRAPEFAQLGAAVRRGNVPGRFDITKQLMEAVKIIRDAKRDNKRVREAIEGTKQTSLIEEAPRDPVVEKLVRAMYRPGLGRMLSQPTIDKILNQYVTQAREQKEKDLFGENKTTPESLIDAAYAKNTAEPEAPANGQGGLSFDEESTPAKDSKEPKQSADLQDVNDTSVVENQSRAGKTSGGIGSPEDVAKVGGRDFMAMSTNRDININKQVFADAGHDPNKAVNYAPLKQRNIIVSHFKKHFNMKVTMDNKMSIKDQIDHLADMYVGMNNMAASLSLPAKAMSLGGTIELILEGGKKPYLGAYSHGKKIMLPNKSNSFAHEWLHALDHYLLEKYNIAAEPGKLFSGAARAMGIADPANPVQSAFANLMTAMFFDKAEIAAKIIELEAKVQTGRTEKSRKEAADKLKQIKEGNYRGIKDRSEYYKSAKTMPNPDYFASPEEMMARALEAYVGNKLDQAGVTTRGVSKINLAYNSSADDRMAKTFPKLQDREAIFDAFDSFFSALGESELLGADASPVLQKNPDFLGVFDPKYWTNIPTGEEKLVQDMGWLRRQLAFIKADIARSKEERAIQKEERAEVQRVRDILNPKEPGFKGFVKRLGRSFLDSGAVALWNHVWRTERTLAHAIEKANPRATSLRELNDRVFTRPGQATAVSETYNQAVATSVNKGSVALEKLMTTLKRAADSNKVRLNKEENDQLRNAMLDLPVTVPEGSTLTKGAIEATAAKLRLYADQQWKAMKNAGLEVGYYAKGAWLRRHYNKDAIMADPAGFEEAATNVYKDQFDEVFGGVDQVIKNIDDFREMVQGILKSDPDGLSFDSKKMKELEKALEDNDTDKVREIVAEIYDEVRDAYSRLAAQSWYANLVADRSRGEFESTFPKPGFMHKRGLPNSADVLLKDFMETNVERILFHYMVAGNTAIAQKNALNPTGKKSMKQLLNQARKDGADPDAVTEIEASINRVIFGPDTGPTAKRIGKFISLLRMGSILQNLNKVVFSAIVEPQVIALKTRDVRNSFKAYSDQLADMLKTNEGKYFQEVSRQLGAIGTDYADMMQQERMGGGFETGLLTREVMAKFFRYTGNTGITNIQSRVAIRAGYRWLNYVTDKYTNGTAKEKSMAERDLAELGIGKEKAESFSLWLKNNDGRPDLNAANNDSSDVFGSDFMKAVVRFRDQAIQHPKKEDRPALANHPVGSVLYTGLGFTFSFWDNVVKAETKRVKAIADNEGGAEAAKVIAHHVMTIGAMVVTTALINALRMAVFDHDKWEESMRDDPEGLTKLLLGRALENTNLLGPSYSVLFNMYRGTQYERDPATSLSGMVLSGYLNWLMKGMQLFTERNSDKNTNAEREFAKQSYRVAAAPALTAALLQLPGPGKLLAAPVGLAAMFINSNTAADRVADTVVGPKTGGKSAAKKSESREPSEAKNSTN